jgi:hypothetical protein
LATFSNELADDVTTLKASMVGLKAFIAQDVATAVENAEPNSQSRCIL